MISKTVELSCLSPGKKSVQVTVLGERRCKKNPKKTKKPTKNMTRA